MRRHFRLPGLAVAALSAGVACALVGCGTAAVSPSRAGATDGPISSLPPAQALPAQGTAGPSSTFGATTPSAVATSSPTADVVQGVVLAARLPVPLSRSAAVSLNAGILVLGGMLADGTTTNTIYRFAADGSAPRLIGHLVQPRHDVAAALIGSRVLVIGGGDATVDASVESITVPGTSQLAGHLPSPRADLSAIGTGSDVVVVGGAGATYQRAVLCTSDGVHFRTVAMLPVGLRYAAVVGMGDLVFVIGGTSPAGDVSTIERIDLGDGTVRTIGHLPFALSHASGLSLDGRLLIAGGRRSGIAQRGIWELDPATGRVRIVGQLPYAVSDAPAASIGQVGYLFGGEASDRLATIIGLRFP